MADKRDMLSTNSLAIVLRLLGKLFIYKKKNWTSNQNLRNAFKYSFPIRALTVQEKFLGRVHKILGPYNNLRQYNINGIPNIFILVAFSS